MGCGLTKPTKLSADLAEVDGKKEAPRTEDEMLAEAILASIERDNKLQVNNFFLKLFILPIKCLTDKFVKITVVVIIIIPEKEVFFFNFILSSIRFSFISINPPVG